MINRFRSHRASQLLLLSMMALIISSSGAIIIRHDVNPSRYEVSASAYPAVFLIEQQGRRKVCAATVIHRQWALTAAHCIQQTMLGNTLADGRKFAVVVAGQTREIDLAIAHPEFAIGRATDVDLALLRFRQQSNMPRPMPLQLQEMENGSVISLLGWGYFGLGTTGRQYNDGGLRLAMNRITSVDRRFRIEFDDPRDIGNNALPLEGMPSLGDSGGPALLNFNGSPVLAGITIGEIEAEDFSEETQGKYGAIAVYESVVHHIDWIASVIGSSAPFDS